MTKWSYLRMCQHKKEPKNQSQIEQNCEQLCFDRAVPAKERWCGGDQSTPDDWTICSLIFKVLSLKISFDYKTCQLQLWKCDNCLEKISCQLFTINCQRNYWQELVGCFFLSKWLIKILSTGVKGEHNGSINQPNQKSQRGPYAPDAIVCSFRLLLDPPAVALSWSAPLSKDWHARLWCWYKTCATKINPQLLHGAF